MGHVYNNVYVQFIPTYTTILCSTFAFCKRAEFRDLCLVSYFCNWDILLRIKTMLVVIPRILVGGYQRFDQIRHVSDLGFYFNMKKDTINLFETPKNANSRHV